MKEKQVLSIVLIVLLMQVAPVWATSTDTTLDVSVAKYEPYPVEPGRYFDLWFKIDNTGSSAATNATFTLEPEFPFSTDDNPLEVIGMLNPLDTTTIKYRVRVDENAVEGTSKLDVKYSTNPRTSITVSKSFSIEIRTHDADVGIDTVATSPKEFLPGEKGIVTIAIKNLADSTLNEVTVNIDLTGTTIPFAPIETSTSKKIKTMAGGKTETIQFSIIATPDAASGIYKVPVSIKFSDNVGNDYASSEIISLVIGGTPNVLTNVEPEEIFLTGTTGDIRVNVINRGLVDIKYVSVKITPTDAFELLSGNEAYIGNIDSDDYDSASFKVHVMPSFSGELSIPATITYMNANNNAYEKKYNLYMRVYTPDEAQSLGLVAGGAGSTYYIIALLVVGYLGYRWYKKRKNRD